MARRVQLRRDTAANWAAVDPILAQGEMGVETDTRLTKVGTGVLAWTALPYAATAADAAVTALDAKLRPDISGPRDGVTDATAAFAAAATTATGEGRNTVSALPGLYHCPNMTSDDMGGVYIVGDGVRFTATTYVSAFSVRQWAARNKTQLEGGSGRGVIALEVDDALTEQWTQLFPLVKELGIPIGVAWPTNNNQKWLKEAWRHGWELLAHGQDHENFTTLTEAQIDAICVASRTAIEAITGPNPNLSFVYPQHARSDETDRIISKHFVRGRGHLAGRYPAAPAGFPWLVGAIDLSGDFSGGTFSASTKAQLQGIAASDGRALFYTHWLAGWPAGNAEASLREFVAYVRSLGITMVLPGKLLGSKRITDDPYLERSSLALSGAVYDTVGKYHGARSILTTANNWNATQAGEPVIPGSQPGMFSVYRASLRYRADADIGVSNGWGLSWGIAGRTRSQSVADVTIGGYEELLPKIPSSGLVIPAAQWARESRTMILGPDVTWFYWRLSGANMGTGLYLDELKMEMIDRVSALRFNVNLNGTTGVVIDTGVVRLDRYAVAITPQFAAAGRIWYSIAASRLTVQSTDATDTGVVCVTVMPTLTYSDYTWPTGGA